MALLGLGALRIQARSPCHRVTVSPVQLDAESNLRKARQAYVSRCEEHDKARSAASRAEEDGGNTLTKSLDKKRRAEEEARGKVSRPPRPPL